MKSRKDSAMGAGSPLTTLQNRSVVSQPEESEKPFEAFKQWLPKNFHELLYAVLTIACAVEALRTGTVPIQLMGLWMAAAGQVGIPSASSVFTNIMEHVYLKGQLIKQQPPKIE